jgi:hypothetical protein
VRWLLLALFLGLVFAEVYLQSAYVNVTLSSDGSASVSETYRFTLTGLSIGEYVKMLDNSTLADWSSFLNEVSLHVSSEVVKDLEILPQPLSQYSINEARASGQLILKYQVIPNSLFTLRQVKPRVVRYRLNQSLLSFKRTEAGHIILDKSMTLQINVPEGFKIQEINPKPKYANTTSVIWRGTVLPNFEFVAERHFSYGEEIMMELNALEKRIVEFFSSEDGLYAALYISVLLAFYVMYVKIVGG